MVDGYGSNDFCVGPGSLRRTRRVRGSFASPSRWPIVLVYPVIPAAVATLVVGGHSYALPRFWTIVLLAEFISLRRDAVAADAAAARH